MKTTWALRRLTMNPTVSTMADGDMATKWRRFAAVTIVQPMEMAAHLRTLTDPHLLPIRFRLFHRGLVPVARDHIEVRLDKLLGVYVRGSAKLPFVGIAGVQLFCVPIPDGFIYTPQKPPYPIFTFPASTMSGTWRFPPDSLSISSSRALSFFTS